MRFDVLLELLSEVLQRPGDRLGTLLVAGVVLEVFLKVLEGGECGLVFRAAVLDRAFRRELVELAGEVEGIA